MSTEQVTAEFRDWLHREDWAGDRIAHEAHSRYGQLISKLQADLEISRQVSHHLGVQLEQLTASGADMPREIQELIYRASCCQPTPELAQKEPCACVAAAIVEQCEDWLAAQITKAARDGVSDHPSPSLPR